MKTYRILLVGLAVVGMAAQEGWTSEKPLRVVATLPDYAAIAKAIGGDRITAQAIVQGEQDAHYIRPKPSFVAKISDADVLLDTGLDLEMWLPTVVDKSGNTKVRSGQSGYVAVSKGLNLLEKPKVLSRSEGGVHVYGNPHITSSPVNMRTVARNIAAGLIKNDPEGKTYYQEHAEKFIRELDERMFGKTLVDMLGGDTLAELAAQGKLYGFLEKQTHEGQPLIKQLGGWMKQMLPLRGTPIVTYHKNWVYFFTVFELEEAGTVEPKPGIPPSPNHVLSLIENMRQRDIRILLAANYFDQHQVETVAARVNADPVIVPLYVEGEKGVESYFDLVNLWVERLLRAARNRQVIK
ncbi:MAG: metal ABC transporter substrate-binding protein [Verrucomicrobia bacterium]|nr:metal ABC transporter substrate-binding protein [Verrucomicrobiota bacterium]MBU1733944.1 metal ABC transporter substrate-binding protein [Verrucomicrobiota bacterium]MBU1857298.1 metal ABC transporter substrate-binding protein [Verrucomicrobiota bacterium]